MDILMGGSQRVKNYLGEAALSLRVRLRGTKFANPCGFAHEMPMSFRGFLWNTSFPSLD